VSTIKKIESIARNIWLAGLGSIDSNREKLSESFDKAQKKTTDLYNDLVEKGEQAQAKLDAKVEENKTRVNDYGRKYFSVDFHVLEGQVSDSQLEKIDHLSEIVDSLTDTVATILKNRTGSLSFDEDVKSNKKINVAPMKKTISRSQPKKQKSTPENIV
jgi:ElaB/YqjD/DUF883 family membrane-anchored ribosome-binding protein